MFLTLFVRVLFYLEWKSLVSLMYVTVLTALLTELNKDLDINLTVYSSTPVFLIKTVPAHYYF